MVLFIAGGTCAVAFAEDDKTHERGGYRTSSNSYLRIPSDMKVQKIANNVITAEPDSEYMDRRFNQQQEELDAVRERMQDLENRLKVLEEQQPKGNGQPA